MKTYTIHYKTSYSNKIYVVAAENALAAVNICQIALSYHNPVTGAMEIPANHEFEAEIIEGVTSRKEGIKSKISF